MWGRSAMQDLCGSVTLCHLPYPLYVAIQHQTIHTLPCLMYSTCNTVSVISSFELKLPQTSSIRISSYLGIGPGNRLIQVRREGGGCIHIDIARQLTCRLSPGGPEELRLGVTSHYLVGVQCSSTGSKLTRRESPYC